MAEFTKLSNLIGQDIKIESVLGFQFKKWDTTASRMLVSDNWQEGYRKLWQVVTDKGQLDLSDSQLGALFVGVQHSGKSEIVGAVYTVRSNGKTGIDIRYYLNPARIESVNQDDGGFDGHNQEKEW